MNDPYGPRINDIELIVCEKCEGMFYGDPKDPECNGCKQGIGWDGDGREVK